jgi:hypothetical protein
MSKADEIDVVIRIDDLPLIKRVRGRKEKLSQYERACQIRDQFAHCMRNALCSNACDMPGLCANCQTLHCAHLYVDYANFTGNGIPLTKFAQDRFHARLIAIGTQVYRAQSPEIIFPLPGDKYIKSLERVSHFTGKRKTSRAPAAKRARAGKTGGFFSRLFG